MYLPDNTHLYLSFSYLLSKSIFFVVYETKWTFGFARYFAASSPETCLRDIRSFREKPEFCLKASARKEPPATSEFRRVPRVFLGSNEAEARGAFPAAAITPAILRKQFWRSQDSFFVLYKGLPLSLPRPDYLALCLLSVMAL